MKENNKLLLLTLGLGAFSMLTFSSFAYLIKFLIRDISLCVQNPHNTNYWLSELTSLFVFGIGSFLWINWFSKQTILSFKKLKQLFSLFIGAYVFVQTLQFIEGYYGMEYLLEHCRENYHSYYEYLKSKPLYLSYSSLFIYSKHFLFGIFIIGILGTKKPY